MRYPSLRQGLIGAWCPSLGATGYRLLDRSGYGNHGTLTNMNAGTDWVGNGDGLALDFDSSDDWVSIIDSRQWHQSDFSLCCFANFRGNGEADYGTVFSRDNGGTNWMFFSRDALSQSGKMSINFFDGANNPSISSLTALSLAVWYHVAFTVQANTASIYVNGKLEATGSIASWTRPIINNLQLGRWNLTGGRTMDGFIDDVRLYSRALTAAEVAILATRRRIGLEPKPPKLHFGDSLSSRRRKILTGLT